MISIYISCKNINVYRIFIWNVYSYPFSTVNINFSILPFGIIYRLFTIFSYTLCIICNIFVRRAPKTILIMSIPILFICINLEIYRRQFRDRFCFCFTASSTCVCSYAFFCFCCFFSYYTFIPLMTICGTIFCFLRCSTNFTTIYIFSFLCTSWFFYHFFFS